MGSLASGGAEHQMCILSNMLVDKGYSVTIPTYLSERPDHYYLDPRIKRQRIAPGKKNFIRVLSLMFHVLTVKTDVVISWGPMQSVFILSALLFRPSIKAICGERNYTGDNPSVWEKILYNTGLYRRAKYIIPNSYTQAEYEKKAHPSYSKMIDTITNYTNLDEYKATPIPSNNPIRIGIFCRMERQKNFVRFIDALSIIRKKTDVAFKIDWYGNHTFTNPVQVSYFEEGLSKIKQYGLGDCITLHDRVMNVSELIPAFDVMCLPSLFEGFSNSISEYICCGRPVICSDVSDNHVMVHDGENGLLFDPNNVDSIVSAFLKYFAMSNEQRIDMGLASRKIAEGLFSEGRFINSYIKLIES